MKSRSILSWIVAGALLLGVPLVAAAQMDQGGSADLEQVLAAGAETPAEHQALARHYRAKAAKAREKAESHRWMSEHYSGSLKQAIADKQRQHCALLARRYDGQARTFDQLAQGHEEAAAQ